MRIFDFDNTLYHGESPIDLAVFMIRKNKRILLWLPRIFWELLKYKLCICKREAMQKQIDRFMQSCFPDKSELDVLVKQFWKSHLHKLDMNIIGRIRPSDAVNSAGPEFLLFPIKDLLGTSTLICSKVDLESKRVTYLNFGDRKVRRYREMFGERLIDAFYTDSFNDMPMMRLSKRVYFVRNGRIKRIK